MAKNNSNSEWHRWLVILYAAGVVAIGYKILENKHGDVFEFFASQTRAIAKPLSQPTRKSRASKQSSLFPERRKPDITYGRQQEIDKLTNKDKEQLDNLLEDID